MRAMPALEGRTKRGSSVFKHTNRDDGTKPELIINLETAWALGLSIPTARRSVEPTTSIDFSSNAVANRRQAVCDSHAALTSVDDWGGNLLRRESFGSKWFGSCNSLASIGLARSRGPEIKGEDASVNR
jgi:hypothetical protein